VLAIVTILLLSVYATGNDSRLLLMEVSLSCTRWYRTGLLVMSGSYEVLSLQIVRWVDCRV